MMLPDLPAEALAEVPSPALVVFESRVRENLGEMLRIAGSAERLRPHCKTHKQAEIVGLQLQLGITKHKCATFAEAEMLAGAGVKDICLAYSLVGPNQRRAAAFRKKFPDARLSVTGDDADALRQLGDVLQRAETSVAVLLDIDSGQHRTGLAADDRAEVMYRLIADTPGLEPGGLHLYDGQNHQTDLDERRAAVLAVWEAGSGLRDRLQSQGLPVPRLVAGGSGSFPIFAEIDDPQLELSPGTCAFWDAGYGEMFPDLAFQPAAWLLTRVISRPTAERVTLDLGYKAVASDPPAGRRVVIPAIPDAREVLHNEEHLVIETSSADQWRVGDAVLAVPRHICPTSALHQSVHVIRDGRVVEQWQVASRDRVLTI